MPGFCLRGRMVQAGPLGLGAAPKRTPPSAPPTPKFRIALQKLPQGRPLDGCYSRRRQEEQARTAVSTFICRAGGGQSALEGLNPWLTERGYQILGILGIAGALHAILNPGQLAASFLKTSGSAVFNHANALCAGFALVFGYFALSVKGGAAAGELESPPIKRMATWMCLERLASLAIKSPLLKANASVTTGMQVFAIGVPAVVTALFLLAYKKLPIDLSVLNDTWCAAKSTFNPQNKVAACYSVVVVAAVGVAIAALAYPGAVGPYILTDYSAAKSLSLGEKEILIVRVLGLLLSYLAVSAYLLKEAAERGQLGAGIFKNLNLTLLAVNTANAASKIAFESAKSQLPSFGLILSLYVALLCGYQFFTAK